MKKVSALFASILFATIINAQQTTSPAPVSTAEIAFEKEVHDFGTIQQGDDGTVEFKFKNTGKDPLIITKAQGSCGCTVPTAPLNQPFKSGETGVIKVHYDTNRLGGFTKTVTVTTNGKTGTKVITIKGKVESPEDVFPTQKKPSTGAPVEKQF